MASGEVSPCSTGCFCAEPAPLAGIPGFLGYISKTLVHEAVVELAVETGSSAITAVEWLFLLSGGLTAAYLTKNLCGGILAEGPGRCPRRLPALGNAPSPWRR